MSGFSTAQDLLPEGILLLGALVVAGLGAVRPRTSFRTHTLLSVAALTAAGLSCLAYLRGMPHGGYVAYSAGLVVDRWGLAVTALLCVFAAVSALGGATLRERIEPHAAEYHTLLLTATLGAVLLAAAREMIALYVSLELLSLSLYILVGLVKTDRRGSEAAFKYLILGVASSAMLLYGFAILYGLSGSTVLTEVGETVRTTPAAAAFGIALVLAGLSFKLGVVPFQQWVPDVYEGAPAPIAGLIASLSKAAGFAVVVRLVVAAFPSQTSTWTAVVAILAAAGMVVGNMVALAQRRMRRLLGWSSVGQAGFVLMGVLGWRDRDGGDAATLFYLLAVGITTIGAFAAVAVAEGAGIGPRIDDYRGLRRRSPLAAAMLAVAMVSLVGVPPLLGFFAKLFVFEAAVSAGYAWLLLVGVAMTAVSVMYYLRVLRALVVDTPGEEAEPVEVAWPARAAIGACVLATAALGALAQPLLAIATGAAGSLH